MIEFTQEPLSLALEHKLRRWLMLPEVNILRRVIIAECQVAQAAALAKALVAHPGDAKDLLMQDDLKQAARFSTFLEILDQTITRDKNLPFLIAKLKPTAIYGNDTNRTDEDQDS